MGYVQVNHGRIQEDMEDMLDLNDDGKVDGHDGQIAYRKLMRILEFNLPAGSGYAAGFVAGLRSG